MSEAKRTMVFLALSGGLMDAYSYFGRGKVFANAQTGNIVLMSAKIADGEFAASLRYLLPLCAFALGVIAAQEIHTRFPGDQGLHWRQIVIAMEMVMLGIVGLIPADINPIANALLSFACAMQVQAFRTVRGSPYASTMCIGNLRSAMDHLDRSIHERSRRELHLCGKYLLVVFAFAFGAVTGYQMICLLGLHTIWISCGLLLVSFVMMIPKEAEHEAD